MIPNSVPFIKASKIWYRVRYCVFGGLVWFWSFEFRTFCTKACLYVYQIKFVLTLLSISSSSSSFIFWSFRGQQDSSMGESICRHTWQSEFNTWNPQSRIRTNSGKLSFGFHVSSQLQLYMTTTFTFLSHSSWGNQILSGSLFNIGSTVSSAAGSHLLPCSSLMDLLGLHGLLLQLRPTFPNSSYNLPSGEGNQGWVLDPCHPLLTSPSSHFQFQWPIL